MSKIDLQNITVWANNEDNVSYPGTTLEDVGYLGEEQPFNEHHNWIWNVRDKRLNALTDRANRTNIASPSMPIDEFCSGLHHNINDWVHPYSGYNAVSFGANNVINMCRGWNYTRGQEVIYAILEGDQTKVREIRNSPTFEAFGSEDHSVTLDAPGTETMEAICCDGPYVYILVSEAGGFGKVYKFSTNPWSPTKVASQVSTTLIDTTGVGRNKIIVANASNIAWIGKGESTDSGKVIRIFSKDFVTVLSGRGNAPSSATYYPGTGLASDGSTVFFTVLSTALGNPLLCAANISDPTQATGLGGAFTAKTLGSSTQIGGDVIYDGRHVSVIRNDGYIASFNKDIDRYKSLDFLFENAKLPTGEPFAKMIHDGFTAWSLMQHDGDDDSNNGFIAPFRPQEICLDHPTTRIIQKKEFISSYTVVSVIMGEMRLEYADGCLWYNPRVGSSTHFYRLPNILNRR